MAGVAIVTGAGGLIGSQAATHFAARGLDVVGIDNDMRARFFGPSASTEPVLARLESECDGFRAERLDIRDRHAIERLLGRLGSSTELIVHAAAQPSHDWAASDPHTDFEVNATGTLNLLEAARRHSADATFAFLSTNKVYGDRPNGLPLLETETRLELPEGHRWFGGIDTTMSIDGSTHSLFGVSKTAADLAVQEYGRYFEMPTVCLRAGCLTGPQHAGAKLHGFLSYLMMCTVSGTPYTVLGYGGKQVRDNLHSADVVRAIECFHRRPRAGAVYNLGGGRGNSISMLEAIAACERIASRSLEYGIDERARIGDHRWWISDLDRFRADYPEWEVEVGIERILHEIHEQNVERWTVGA
jgi:CDP-paratose 2-epimerase